ncbi:MAG TPA: hypothetical protein VFI79_00575 [Gemmatimonadales bacterium]|nr:hypothetical protein [Gemmatimonadales bacterium]
MTAALLSRLASAAIINVPLAWLAMSSSNHRVAEAIATGQVLAPRMHGFGFWLFALMIFGLCYVLFVEVVAFLLRGDWRRAGSSPEGTGRLTSA